jgi:quinol monooxygenase YgiN
MADTLLVAAAIGAGLALAVRGFSIDLTVARRVPDAAEPLPVPEAPAAELVPLLRRARGRVMETVHYRVEQQQRDDFLAAMAEVRKVRGRAGAMFWQLYEDVAHPEGWMEVWSVESWTDHLREVTRLSEDDRAALARAGVFQCGGDGPRPARYIAVDPH